jgi:hypothetical protein
VEYVGMNAEADSPEPESGDRGVFGNLPSQRPGVRSPRRDGGKQASVKGAQRKASAAKATTRSRPTPKSSPGSRTNAPKPSPPPREPAPARQPPEAGQQGRGIEDVAWAGVTVAAEAATLGVRLFSRALEAVRERR